MIFVGLKRYFISTISNHSLSVQLRVLTAETMEISASLNKLVVVKGQAGSTTEAVLFRSIFCKIRWEQQVLELQHFPINLSFWGFDVLNYCFDVSIKKHQDSTPPSHTLFEERGGPRRGRRKKVSRRDRLRVIIPWAIGPVHTSKET